MNIDRFGQERCQGYTKEDFLLCSKCCPNPNKLPKIEDLDENCKICGGYGEYPRKVNHANS